MGHRHQTTDTTRLKRLVDDGIPTETIAVEFGVTQEAVKRWLKLGTAPYWTRCAIKTLERRQGQASRVFLLIEVPNKNAPTLTDVIKAMGGEVHLSINL